jgi:hypothetical protein
MPKAINSVVFRIAVFYVGSLILLALLLPYTAYQQGTSPFVTLFSSIGVPAAWRHHELRRVDGGIVQPERRSVLPPAASFGRCL